MLVFLRRLFLIAGLLGLLGWVYFYTWYLGQICLADGISAQDCVLRLPWQLSLKEATLMLVVPGFLVCTAFLAAFMLGGAATDELRQIERRTAADKDK